MNQPSITHNLFLEADNVECNLDLLLFWEKPVLYIPMFKLYTLPSYCPKSEGDRYEPGPGI